MVEQEMLRSYQNASSSPATSPSKHQDGFDSGPPSPTYNTMPPQQQQQQQMGLAPLNGNGWGNPSSPTREHMQPQSNQMQQPQQPLPNGINGAWAQNNTRKSAPPPGFMQQIGSVPTTQTQPFRATPGRPRPPGFVQPQQQSAQLNQQLTQPTKPVQPVQPVQPTELPYGGDLNAAMKAQDREAIRLLMDLRDKVNNTQQKQKRDFKFGSFKS